MRSPRCTAFLLLALAAICCLPAAAAPDEAFLRSPESGEVYKEYTRFMSGFKQWRITDPFATAPGSPGNMPSTFLPNDVLPFEIGDLVDATRAEAVIEVWGGHTGTTGKRFRLNGNAWLNIPELETPPTRGECYNHQYNVVVDVPISHLESGGNTLEGTSGRQSCYSFQWGQWGWYQLTIRVYYDPAAKPAPEGSIIADPVMGENPTVRLATTDEIDRVDFFAYYDGYDTSGDGDFVTYHHNYARTPYGPFVFEPSNHVGSATAAPWEVTWDTSLVPDQPAGSVKLIARVRSTDGTWRVTDELTGLTLDRGAQTVRLYKPKQVPENFWVRANQNKLSRVFIPAGVDLNDAVSAHLLVRTWNGIDGLAEPGQDHYTKVNNWTTPEYGSNHYFSYDVVDVPPSALVNGDNIVRFWSQSSHHGKEILWPGPALVIRFAGDSPAVCGDLSLDPGEECDDGNVEDQDGCDPDCQIGTVDYLKPPQPGEVYRDFTRIMSISGNLWRVTDPGASGGATAFLPNPGIELEVGDLEGATRAQAVVSIWGGHLGTTDKRFRLNGMDWIPLPELATTPTPGQCYTQQFNATVDVPLGDLVEGINTLEGTAGPQTCASFNWGQWGWYLFTVRVYYDPATTPHATANITGLASGDVLGANPTITVEAAPPAMTSITGLSSESPRAGSIIDLEAAPSPRGVSNGIARVELYAFHDGYDTDGDGNFVEYHHDYHPMPTDTEFLMRNHVGSDDTPPYEITWDTSQVPDQAWKGIKFVARVLGTNGVWSVTPEIDGISLQRPASVRLYKPKNMPEGFWISRRRRKDAFFEIPADHDLTQAQSATLHLRTWNGNDGLAENGETHFIALNAWTLPEIGANHYYSYDRVDPPTSALRSGSNTLTVYSQSTHHGIELLWPGPALVVRYLSDIGECGDEILDPTEECDDGNLVDGDGCSPACLQRVCGDNLVSLGEDCDDGNREDGDGCDADCREEICGNGITQVGEECDDDNNVEDDACNNACEQNYCGDGAVNNGEDCEDGNTANADGCDENCREEVCGNGIAQFGEQCDDGNNVADDACNNACEENYCGDGAVNNGEDCEDGNTTNGDDCDENCREEVCGNGVTQLGEECDDGNVDDDDSCSNSCVINYCGDGIANNGEQCDDGNLNDLDVCSNTCRFTVVCENDLVNGDFGDGSAGWFFFADTSANLLQGTNELRVKINVQGSNIQLLQTPISLEPETTYRVRLMARNTLENDVTVVVQKHGAPYSSYGLAHVFNLTTTMSEHSVEFTTPAGLLNDARLALLMSPHDQDGTNYYFADINLEKVEECPLTVCGNGIAELGEGCDDGLDNSDVNPNACRSDCTTATCGDGVVDDGEQCDDGGTDPDDGCDAACMTEAACGNGVVEAGEECDDGNSSAGDGCDAACRNETECGNGELETGEQCDDGNVSVGDACDENCVIETCGNGVMQAGEGCDDGNDDPDDACNNACEANYCGDGFVNNGEDCEDGNSDNGDGCDTGCRVEVCGNGVAQTGEECDDGNTDDDDSCRTDCILNFCGDGFTNNGEECDDGNLNDLDLCSNACRLTVVCENELVNGDFANGSAGWFFYTDTSANLLLGIDEARIKINAQGSNIQLSQTPIALEPGTAYRVRLMARNTLGNDVTVVVQKHGAPYSFYGLAHVFDLTTTMTEHSVEFTTPAGISGDARLMLFMSPHDQNGTNYYFADVNLEKLADCPLTVCGNGIVETGEACDGGPDNSDATADACRTDCTAARCGDGVIDSSETCDDASANSDTEPDACRSDCSAATCGDGVIDDGEQCDDGGTAAGDGCDAACQNEGGCGNDVIDIGEDCDDGTNNSDTVPDACRNDCTEARCGDGVRDSAEECDGGSGNSDSVADACRTTCTLPICGDGVEDNGEACDDGNLVDDDACSNLCESTATCENEFTNGTFENGRAGWFFWSVPASPFTAANGHFTVTIPQQTSNGQLFKTNVAVAGSTRYRLKFRARNSLGNDVSVNLFQHAWPFTGFGLGQVYDLTPAWQEFETTFTTPPGDRTDGRFSLFFHPYDQNGTVYEFDDFSFENLDACAPSVCGDGRIDPGESCDNGPDNSDDATDACRLDCSLATCGDGVQDSGEACDNGPDNSDDATDACRLDCSLATCGDGVQDSGEACDNGPDNSDDATDACRLNCSLATCGDGVQDSGEACDDGNVDETDGCTSSCVATGSSENLIGNGDFENGVSPWFFYQDADVRFRVTNGVASLLSVAEGTNVQLLHTGFELLPGRQYRLSFRGRHTTGRDIHVGVMQHTAPYSSYGLIRRVNLGTTMNEHVLEFTTPVGSTTTPRLMLHVGAFDAIGQTYYLDDVVLQLLP